MGTDRDEAFTLPDDADFWMEVGRRAERIERLSVNELFSPDELRNDDLDKALHDQDGKALETLLDRVIRDLDAEGVQSSSGSTSLREKGDSGSLIGKAPLSEGSTHGRVARHRDPQPERFRFAVGRVGGRPLLTDPYRGVTVIGPVRSGKTTGVVVPALARQPVRTIAISVRADVINATAPYRFTKGPVWIVDPMGMLPRHRTIGWNPLRLCVTWDACVDFAYSFVMSAAMTGILDGGFWYAKAAQLLSPLLLAAAANGYTMGDVVRWVRDQDDFEVRALLQATGEETAVSSFEAIASLEERARGSIYATLHACLRVFDSTQVVASTTGRGFDLDEFFASEAGVLYLAAPPHRQRQLAPLYSALINHVIYRAVEEQLETSAPADLLVLLDEAGNFPVPNLDVLATTAAGSGIQLVTVFHDVSQMISLYGEDRTQTIISNQSALLVLPGARDSKTIELLDELVAGDEVPGLPEGSGAALLRHIPRGKALYFYDTEEPALIDVQSSWRDDDLIDLLSPTDEGIEWMLGSATQTESSDPSDEELLQTADPERSGPISAPGHGTGRRRSRKVDRDARTRGT